MATQISISKALGLTAAVGFVLLYPGFFIYHFAVGSEFFSPFALGLYGPTTLFIAAIGGIPLALTLRRHVGRSLVTATVTFFFYCIAWVVYFGYTAPDNPLIDIVNAQSFTILTSWTALYIVGLFFPWNSNRLRLTCFALLAIITLIAIANTNWSSRAMSITVQGASSIASYQGFARSVFVLSFALLAWSKNKGEMITVWFLSCVLLFVIGARSEFAAYVATTLMVAFIIRRAHPARTVPLVLGIMLVWVLTSGLGVSILDALGQSRQAGLLDLGADTSWNTRQAMNDFALTQIAAEPIFGSYGGHVYFYRPELGSEAHSALSAWVTFGFVGFSLYVGLTAAALWLSIKYFLSHPRRPDVRFAIFMSLSVAILVVSAKSVYWAEPALALGVVTALVVKNWSIASVPLRPAIPEAARGPRRARWQRQAERRAR